MIPRERQPHPVDLLCLAVLLPVVARRWTFTPDFFWHLRLGHDALASRAVQAVERYSWTAEGTAYQAHSWASGALFALVDSIGGLAATEVLAWALIVAACRGVYALARGWGAGSWTGSLAVIGFASGSLRLLTLRPQLFTFVLLCWLLWAWQRWRGGGRALWAAPLVCVLWANLHGAYVLAPALLGLLAAWEAWKVVRGRSDLRRAGVLGALAIGCLLAGFVAPGGPRYTLSALFNTPIGSEFAVYVNEWRPPRFAKAPGFFLAAPLVPALLLGRRARPTGLELILVLGSLAGAMTAWRHVPLFGLIGLPIAAAWASRTWAEVRGTEEPRVGVPRWGSAVVLGAALVLLAGSYRPSDRALLDHPSISDRYPVAAARFVQEQGLPSRGFHTYPWGGCLVWAWAGEPRVWIDGRWAPYLDFFVPDHVPLEHGRPGWQERIDRWGIEWVLAPPDSPLATVLRDAGWLQSYADATAVVLQSPNPARRGVLTP